MAAMAPDDIRMKTPNWTSQEDQNLSTGPQSQPSAQHPSIDEPHANQESENPPGYHRGSSAGDISVSGSKSDSFRDSSHKQAKPNKVYIGGLPEQTREADLQNCFGKIGAIANIELKVGYGFVEFDTREAAEESVAKYNEGHFMGNKIKVELAHGGGRAAKFNAEPGACFRCGQQGHWARECPSSHAMPYHRRGPHDPPLIDRIQRDNYNTRGPPPRDDYSRYPQPPSRDSRYDYPPPPRRVSPLRDYRDYGPPLPRPRDFDDYRRGPPPLDRDRYPPQPPPPPPPPQEYRGRFPAHDSSYRGGYSGAPHPLPSAPYDRYDNRRGDRYGNYLPPPPPPRARSSPRGRDDFDRLPLRDYVDYRGRPPSPQRYPDFHRPPENQTRFRRRSESPRSAAYEYPPNGYGGAGPGPSSGPPSLPPSFRGNSRDYTHPRNGRDHPESAGGYRRS